HDVWSRGRVALDARLEPVARRHVEHLRQRHIGDERARTVQAVEVPRVAAWREAVLHGELARVEPAVAGWIVDRRIPGDNVAGCKEQRPARVVLADCTVLPTADGEIEPPRHVRTESMLASDR